MHNAVYLYVCLDCKVFIFIKYQDATYPSVGNFLKPLVTDPPKRRLAVTVKRGMYILNLAKSSKNNLVWEEIDDKKKIVDTQVWHRHSNYLPETKQEIEAVRLSVLYLRLMSDYDEEDFVWYENQVPRYQGRSVTGRENTRLRINLLKSGPKANVLRFAVKYSIPRLVKFSLNFLTKPSEENMINQRFDEDHATLLCYAAAQGDERVVRVLLHQGADVNKGNPSQLAFENLHLNIFDTLTVGWGAELSSSCVAESTTQQDDHEVGSTWSLENFQLRM